jgi:hypothetical protein
MRRHTTFGRALVALSLAALASALVAPPARAGGPLLTKSNGEPVRWARGPVSGGPLNSQTIDAQGRVLYRVDSGTLGSMSNEQAVALVDRIFSLYNGIPTSTIRFVNAGPILDPRTAAPIDINGNNAGLVLGNNPTFQNPIVFDTDGDITGGGGVLGFFSFLQFGSDDSLEEGTVVLNGATIAAAGGPIPFGGVFTHEFGHFAGPLDHEQSNGNIATHGTGSVLPAGFSEAKAYDVYAPFTETLFPFLFDAPFGSQLASGGFGSSGYFVATLDMDTRNALSNLYPAPGYRATDAGSPNGAISGKVVIRTTDGDIPLTGVNVVARRISESSYPVSASTSAFPNNQVQLDGTGVPLIPPARAETDPLATVESVVTGLADPPGEYTLDGLPPGNYLVEIQQINPFALGGSGIGPLGQQIPLPVVEAYNGASESGSSSDDPSAFVPVTVTAGSVTPNIDVVLNGFPTTALSRADEHEPNEKAKKAQRLSLPLLVEGHTSTNDKFRTTIDFGGGSVGTIQDFYQFETDRDITIFVSLDGATNSGDLDLYLLTGKIGKRIPINDDRVLAGSFSPTTHEFLAVHIPPGKYFLGVSAFDGDLDYALRVLVTS